MLCVQQYESVMLLGSYTLMVNFHHLLLIRDYCVDNMVQYTVYAAEIQYNDQ